MENFQKYLTINAKDEQWGITVTTAGCQGVAPRSAYPLSNHPDSYIFTPTKGRTLNEYQLIYITRGGGYFSSKSCKKTCIEAGTILLLFPDEWHSYYPDKESGWDEYWVGFRGEHIDRRIRSGFFTRQEPIYKIGISSTIVSLYENIIKMASAEKVGYQQVISSMVLHMLSLVYYKNLNKTFSNSKLYDTINQAKIIMAANTETKLSAEEIADNLGIGYSWFRRMFKEYVGVSPAQYQIQLKLLRAKELLIGTEKTISEISFLLNFESTGQFSTFFKKKEKITPSEFRQRAH